MVVGAAGGGEDVVRTQAVAAHRFPTPPSGAHTTYAAGYAQRSAAGRGRRRHRIQKPIPTRNDPSPTGPTPDRAELWRYRTQATPRPAPEPSPLSDAFAQKSSRLRQRRNGWLPGRW